MKENVIKIGVILAVIAGIYIYFQQRAYIGYFIALLAIPYGAYGLFKPYKSATAYVKKGFAHIYSRQLGMLIVSLGVLGFLFSRIYAQLAEATWFMVVLLVYIVTFFIALYTLNKRYIKKM